jgi:L,D-transpeptidase ErfK/SrfK
MYKIMLFIVTVLTVGLVGIVRAGTWILPPSDIDIFGQMQTTVASREETLLDIARLYDIGQTEILLANPDVDRWLPADGAEVILPSRYIIPQTERKGLVLNLAEMRIYYFPKAKKDAKPVVTTHPVGIGRMDWETPLGKTKVIGKKKDPTWTPPQSLKDAAIAAGDPPLPDVVPAGPDNPLGRFAIRLGVGDGSYLIHGTHKPFGIGMRVSAGCVRMYPEDIETMFAQVPIGTQVHIINEPIKLGWLGDSLFVELHPPLEEDADKYTNYDQIVFETVNDFIVKKVGNPDGDFVTDVRIDYQALQDAIASKDGIPTLISK